ncbi:MAG: hypothetical protein PHS49_06730 [Candidatus Gracilibacteria bacterium]|nr:hypothetical protein [Candidatus Gracilibacteria bacterium]
MYSYLAFFPIFLVFYFGYYIQYDKGEFIPESTFETRLQNIEVSDEENGLVQLGNIYEDDNEKLEAKLEELGIKSRKSYDCIIGRDDNKCSDENIQELISMYTGWDEIDILNNKVGNIVKFEYFKEVYNYTSFPSFLSILTKISLFSTISKLEDGNEDLEGILLYKKIGDKLINGDISIYGIQRLISILENSLNNIDYILNNYDLSNDTLNLLKRELDQNYNTENILINSIKVEYNSSKYFIDRDTNSNMLFNKNELLNIKRNIWLKVINGEEQSEYEKNYCKRTYIYNFLGAYRYSGISSEREWIDKLNIKIENILEKIEDKLNN